jgi:tetratricopeptide (TPR) repeat protein
MPLEAGLWNAGEGGLISAREHFEAGRYDRVITDLTPLTLQRMRGFYQRQAYALLGEAYERLEHQEKALSVYQLAVKLYPKDMELATRLARLLHAAGLDKEAQPLYEKVLTAQPDNTWANLGLAEIDRSLGFLKRSAERYERALEGDLMRSASVWRDYSQVMLEQRDYVTAEAAARKALSLQASNETRLALGFALRGQGRIDEALLQADAASHAGVRALWLLEAGRFEEAAKLCKGQSPLERYVRARFALNSGRKDEARRELEAVAEAAKTAPFAAELALRMLEAL